MIITFDQKIRHAKEITRQLATNIEGEIIGYISLKDEDIIQQILIKSQRFDDVAKNIWPPDHKSFTEASLNMPDITDMIGI